MQKSWNEMESSVADKGEKEEKTPLGGERLCVVMPVYNEREAIGGVLAKWDGELARLGLDYEIRAYNDESRDDTLEVMRTVASKLPRVSVRDKPNGGHGPTILQGYREAAADGFDWIFQIDSDDEMGPGHFSTLWNRRADADFLVGRRAGRLQGWARKLVSGVSRLSVRAIYGKGGVWDVDAPSHPRQGLLAFHRMLQRISATCWLLEQRGGTASFLFWLEVLVYGCLFTLSRIVLLYNSFSRSTQSAFYTLYEYSIIKGE